MQATATKSIPWMHKGTFNAVPPCKTLSDATKLNAY